MSVEFQAKHKRLLEQALLALGWSWVYEDFNRMIVDNLGILDFEEEVAEIQILNQGKLNQLKQEYSKQALRRAAKLQGWQLKSKGTKGVLRR